MRKICDRRLRLGGSRKQSSYVMSMEGKNCFKKEVSNLVTSVAGHTRVCMPVAEKKGTQGKGQ